jgi:hypothetical protein
MLALGSAALRSATLIYLEEYRLNGPNYVVNH